VLTSRATAWPACRSLVSSPASGSTTPSSKKKTLPS
jgi:hypothetical protein